jgi:ferric-dicitrate binding protein FerR (iron transport regulator)
MPGQAATLTAQGISPPVSVPVSLIDAWSQGQLMFDDKPISEVTTEANRYLPVPVVIDDTGLGARRISGSLAIGDTESLLAFLRASADVVIERTPVRIRVYRRGHAAATPAKPGAAHRVPPS